MMKNIILRLTSKAGVHDQTSGCGDGDSYDDFMSRLQDSEQRNKGTVDYDDAASSGEQRTEASALIESIMERLTKLRNLFD